MKIVVFDTETTGVSPLIDEVVSVALIPGVMTPERITIADSSPLGGVAVFHRDPTPGVRWSQWPELYVKPHYRNHGKPFDWPRVCDLVRGALLIGFNVKFDLEMLQATAVRCGYNLEPSGMLCVQRDILPNVDYGRLMDVHGLIRKSAVPTEMAWHNPADDAIATLNILEHYINDAVIAMTRPVVDVRVWPSGEIQKAIAGKLGFRWDFTRRVHRRNFTGAQQEALQAAIEILTSERIRHSVDVTTFNTRTL